MQSLPRPLASTTHYCCNGDVSVAETAVVGAGVVLQALPGSQVRIEAGACIGAGVVIQAKAGLLVVESQASLGTGVLLVGQGYIGRAATVGPASTLINPKVSAHTIIAPNTLLDGPPGQRHASVPDADAPDANTTSSFNPYQPTGPHTVPLTPRTTTPVEPRAVEPKPVETAGSKGFASYGAATGQYSGHGNNGANSNGVSANGSSLTARNTVYGRDQVNGLLSALFPHRQSLNGSGESPSPPTDEDSAW